ncbi:MAG TPA: hypothetical protein VIC82_08100, partial [Candidatus Nanopelagicales bacterium]
MTDTTLDEQSLMSGPQPAGVDPVRMAVALSVFEELEDLPVDHPDAELIRRATAGLFKSVKQRRRRDKRAAVTAADEAVTAATATGAPGRIDDETRGIVLAATAQSETVGTLLRSRSCYVCKTRYREVDAFYHQLCPTCAELNRGR